MATYNPTIDPSWPVATYGANVVWTNWTNTTVTSGTTFITSPWSYWTGTTVTANTTGGAIIWSDWTTRVPAIGFPVRTEEEIAADFDRRRIEQAEWEERAAKQRADAAQAVQRAETLLHAHLDERQRRYLKVHDSFRVKSKSGRWYEVGRGHHGKLTELNDKGERVNNLCVYATGGCPEADQMLAQKLYIENAEEELRRVAYITKVPALR